MQIISRVNKRVKAFTLIEVLVASGVSLLLALTVFNIFFQARRSIEGTSDRLEMIQATRPALARLTAYVASGVTVENANPILYPSNSVSLTTNDMGGQIFNDDPTTWNRILIFQTTEDFLATGFDPEGIMDRTDILNNLGAYETNSQRVSEYMVWWEDTDTGYNFISDVDDALVIARIQSNPTPGTSPRGPNWADVVVGADPNIVRDLTVPYRVLGHGLTDASFHRVNAGTIEVSLYVERQVLGTSGTETRAYRSTSTIQLPTFTM